VSMATMAAQLAANERATAMAGAPAMAGEMGPPPMDYRWPGGSRGTPPPFGTTGSSLQGLQGVGASLSAAQRLVENRQPSCDGSALQAHLDALDGSLGPLSSQGSYSLDTRDDAYPANLANLRYGSRDGGHLMHPGSVSLGGVSLEGASCRSSVDLQGEEALQLFAESAHYDHRQQPYPVGASPLPSAGPSPPPAATLEVSISPTQVV